MGALVDACGWDRKKKKGRGKEKGRGGSRKRTERVCLHFFFFFPQADVSLLWLCSKQTQLVVPTIRKA